MAAIAAAFVSVGDEGAGVPSPREVAAFSKLSKFGRGGRPCGPVIIDVGGADGAAESCKLAAGFIPGP